ncbi:MAG TPA: sialidase family protein, partial [Amycolatopsis sp.]|nr:sialidase family protein [Amycolatopsis sp.]
PNMRNPIYRGQPDSFTETQSTAVGADGGGDVDIAVGLPDPATGANNNPPTVAMTSLTAANISAQRSTDRGVTFIKNPAGNVTGGAPADDRQWLAFYGPNTVYLLYRTLEPAVTQIQRSNDGGLTYGPARTAGAIGQVGSVDVDQRDGTVYIAGSTGQVCAGVPSVLGGEPLTYTCAQAASDPGGVAHLFFIVKVAPDGTVYVAYSNDHDIFLANSTDKGQTWSLPVRVDNGSSTITNVFPHLGTGKAPGSVGVVWYGTSNPVNDNNADWRVFYAMSANASATSPTFRQVEAGDHVIHSSNISEGGLTGTANRNLIDYFQVSFDPVGAAVIAYADDHNDFDGHTYVTRQIGGPGLNGAAVPAPVEGRSLPRATKPPATPQVTDFAQDVQIGLLGVVPANDPLDILSITWSCEDPGAGTPSSNPKLVTKMKVSDLSSLPGVANWRTNFAANAPDSVLSPTGDYSFARSDRGDQFYFRASTDPTQASTFSYGTAVRNSDGSITYTRADAADEGLFDAASGTVTVKVALSKLNALVPAGHAPLTPGAVLAGLRGQTFTAAVNAKTDIARGGTLYTIACGAASAGGNKGGPPGNGNGNVVKVTGGGSIDGKRERFELEVNNGFGSSPPAGDIRYLDQGNGFEMISDTVDTFTQNGSNEVVLSGRGHIGRTAVTYTVRVQDNGDPGTNDFFSIVIPGFPSAQGTLTQGNIQFHF